MTALTSRSMRASQRGFTLFEVILALAMISTLSLALYSSMTIAFKAKKTAEKTIEPARNATIIADLIGRDLENVQPISDSDEFPQWFYGAPAGVSGGASDTLEFFALGSDTEMHAPGGAGDDLPYSQGVRRIYLSVQTDVNPPVLVRRVQRNLLPTTDSPVEDELLCTGVLQFTIRYFDGYSWLDEWDSETVVEAPTLPQAVEINLAVQAPDGAISRVTRIIPMTCAESPAL